MERAQVGDLKFLEGGRSVKWKQRRGALRGGGSYLGIHVGGELGVLPRHDGAVEPRVIESGNESFGRDLGGPSDGECVVGLGQGKTALGKQDFGICGGVGGEGEEHWPKVC